MFVRACLGIDRNPARVSLVFGAILALLALINVLSLSTWHTSMLHHHDAVADGAMLEHGHDHDHEARFEKQATGAGKKQDSPALDMHNVTHAMVHGFTGLVPNLDIALGAYVRLSTWFAGRSFTLSGISPEGLLRPPRV
jgi:hypothetical protein